MTGASLCEECHEPAELKCSACRLVAYCCKEHQRKHWKDHKVQCRPFEVVESKEMGKCLVASRDLQVGDLILSELPLVYGPRPHVVEEGPVPCPGCCRLIIGEESPQCPGCGFPVCQPTCAGLADMDRHGHECLILALRDVQPINALHDFYRQDTLLALRCLILQTRHPKRFAQLLGMRAHQARRGPGSDAHRDVQERLVAHLEAFLAPLRLLEARSGRQLLADASPALLHRISGVIDVNALEINQAAEVSAIYPTAYLMEHNCVCNTVHQFGDEAGGYRVTVRACLPIGKGEHISTMYTHALWGTQARREHLKETKYFECTCRRCGDPTELGSYLSALRCLGTEPGACDGFQLPVDPLDDATEWVCNECGIRLNNPEVSHLINQIGEEVDRVQLSSPTVRELDALLSKMLTFLHPHHYHVYAVKHSLIQLYGYQQGYTPSQITDDVVERKAAMCRELLEVTARVDPGGARLPLYSGVILHELHLANMIAVRRKWDLGIRSKVKSMVVLLRECRSSLEKAIDVLEGEETTPAGGKLKKLVATSMREFQHWVDRNKIEL